MKKRKSSSKRTPAKDTRGDKAAKPLRDLKVTKATDTGVRGGMVVEDFGSTDYSVS